MTDYLYGYLENLFLNHKIRIIMFTPHLNFNYNPYHL